MPKGRPALTGKSKEYMLRIRLDEDERARIEARAKELGKAVSEFIRDLALADSPLCGGLGKKKAVEKKTGGKKKLER